jgi:predicted nucleic acid-binding protein
VSGELLLSTSGLVSLLDRRRPHHFTCALSFAEWKGPVASTEAILTEATRLLGDVAGGRRTCIDFFLGGGAVLVTASAASLRRARELVIQHAAMPMGYADATLVALAEELDTNLVLTLDRHAFGRYRLAGRRSFRIIPSTSLRAQLGAKRPVASGG